ncbi:carbohydrate ABC transporter permease [Hespellia stercorisuis]|uniref:Multiple sugar transport system permease protein n=1 Tax=Hespellia stercorisuis DSM 15480 TaxID=1121950 RepID=A0A1M6MNC3_9FIRM|nr:carbohydrate ABC transporter permease [Hespellia stercorisuis]SHJ84952.1 multiple sugar transport system permease protein [Hespellia stercorisuis DSM 15480]
MKKYIIWAVLFAVGFLACYPVLFLTAGSLMGQTELRELLGPVLSGSGGYVRFPLMSLYPTLRNYVGVLMDSPEFFVMFWNSVKTVAGILAGQLLVSVPAAWGFARYDFPCKSALFTLYILLMMMPFQVTMLSGYLVLDKLQLLDTLWAVILPGVFSTFPVFLIYRFFVGIPQAIIESARIDGAGELQIFMSFGLRLGAPGILSAMVLGFLEYWNLIEQPLTYIKDKSLWPLSLYLPNIGLEEAGTAFAASLLTLVPAMLVFLGGQDYLEQGIMAAAVKE